ncbi:MAG: hypothetical protein ABIV26_02845 [Candidatus Limnocylindrales bacterium]
MSTATALRSIDPAIEEIRNRIDRLPDLSQMDLPSLEALGRHADEAVDRLRGRQRRSALPWVFAGIGVIAIAGVATAFVVQTWSRNRADETWPDESLDSFNGMSDAGTGTDLSGTGTIITTGLSSPEGSLLSYDPAEGRDS